MSQKAVQSSVCMLRVRPERYDKLRIIAERESRSVNNQVNYIIQKFIEQYERDNGVVEVSKD